MTDEEKEMFLESVKNPAGIGIGSWTEQELITRDDLKMIMDAHLKIKEHPTPQQMVGNLYCIDGIALACDAVMHYLERRAILFKGYTKPQQEE